MVARCHRSTSTSTFGLEQQSIKSCREETNVEFLGREREPFASFASEGKALAVLAYANHVFLQLFEHILGCHATARSAERMCSGDFRLADRAVKVCRVMSMRTGCAYQETWLKSSWRTLERNVQSTATAVSPTDVFLFIAASINRWDDYYSRGSQPLLESN
jgi:hypothetical protein